MRLVVDASLAVKWFVEEEYADIAGRLLEGGHELCAPRLLASEVGNALWRKARMGEIGQDRAVEFAVAISQIVVSWIEDESVCPDAVRLSLELEHPVYDCVYLALAQQLGTALVTSDARFADAVAGTEHESLVVTLETLELE